MADNPAFSYPGGETKALESLVGDTEDQDVRRQRGEDTMKHIFPSTSNEPNGQSSLPHVRSPNPLNDEDDDQQFQRLSSSYSAADASSSKARRHPHRVQRRNSMPQSRPEDGDDDDVIAITQSCDHRVRFDRTVSGGSHSNIEDLRNRRTSHRLVHVRPRTNTEGSNSVILIEAEGSNDFHVVDAAENELEARKIVNNYMFGLRIWKSHLSSRPISTRSEIVQELYADLKKPLPVNLSTIRISNIIYTALIGWWIALLYILVGCLMYITILGRQYGSMCFRMANYFFWPFGKFVHQVSKKPKMMRMKAFYTYHTKPLESVAQTMASSGRYTPSGKDPEVECQISMEIKRHSLDDRPPQSQSKPVETTTLLGNERRDEMDIKSTSTSSSDRDYKNSNIWLDPETYLWLVIGIPILTVAHALIWILTWFLVVTIPIAKINAKTITKILFTAPDEIRVGDSSKGLTMDAERHSEIIMYTHQSFNFYYYKYTVDGVNVILANLLVFVVLCIVLGYADEHDEIISPVAKCVLGILAILPVTYYIGMAISSISAQSSFAVGAILNATFGSMVEVILYIIMLKNGKDKDDSCYEELVKSTLTGSILCCILLVPGLSMALGGLKYRKQNFNPRSANISASLLFIAIIGVFAPTIFAMVFGGMKCDNCDQVVVGNDSNLTSFVCEKCEPTAYGPDSDMSIYTDHIRPLIYTCALILPLSYIIGLIFTMKSHQKDIYEDFERLQREEGAGGHHGNAQWSRLKSAIILLLCVTAIALCADLIAENIPPLLSASGMSEYFLGVTVLSIVSMLPEVVNGVQFALQNNVNLGIEIGSAAAIQVCMVQLPVVVLADLIYPLSFSAIFNQFHLWTVAFAVIIINYIFQDGKSDYFQGAIIVFIYIVLMAMYYFCVTPEQAICKTE